MIDRHITHFLDDKIGENQNLEARARLCEVRGDVDRIFAEAKTDLRSTIPTHLLETIRDRLRTVGLEFPAKFPLRQRFRWYCEDTM